MNRTELKGWKFENGIKRRTEKMEKRYTTKITTEVLMNESVKIKRCTDDLIEQLSKNEDVLVDAIEKAGMSYSKDGNDPTIFDFENFGFRWHRSNLASYLRLVSLKEDSYDGTSIFYANCQRGSSYFYHNDFNAEYNVMSREETLRLTEIFSQFVNNFYSVLKKEAEAVAKAEAEEAAL